MSYRYETYYGSYISKEEDGSTSSHRIDSDSLLEIRSDSKRRKPSGFLFPTPYSLSYEFNRGLVGTWENPGPGTLRSRTGQLGRLPGNGIAMNFHPLPGNARNDAIIKALLKLKDQNVNLGVAFAEAQATADLIGSTSTRLARAAQAVKRKDAKGAFKALGLSPNKRVGREISKGGNVPDKWLELQYGWLPLVGDVYGSVKELGRLQRDTMLQTVTSRVSDGTSGAVNQHQGGAGEATYFYVKETGYSIRLDFEPGNDFVNAMSRSGMSNPFEVAWERVPFSFIADWFLPAGDWISSLDATIGWKFYAGSESYLSKVSVKAFPAVGVNPYSVYQGSYKRVELTRNVLTSSPLPVRPGFKNPFSLGHMANGLSLLASVFGSSRPR